MSEAFEIEGGVLREYRGDEAHVSIPDGVTEIGDWAFNRCESLASVAIPNGVTQIGDWAFNRCESLASVAIPESVTIIGDFAFSNCNSLTSISVPEGVAKIEGYAFWNCETLASVSVPSSVTEIGTDAFGSPPATVVCLEGSCAHRHCEDFHIPFVFDYQFEAFHGLLPQGFERLASPFLADEEGPFVFVSYSHKDREQVLPVIKGLYEEGWRIWYDEGLTIGDSYDETLEAHVKDCSAFLLFVTPNSLKSAYIRANEVPWAVGYGKPIVECALEGEERYGIDGGPAAAVSPSDIGPSLERIEGLVKGGPRTARGITVIVDPAARGQSSGSYACCLYSENGTAAAKAVMLEARRAGCMLYDAVVEDIDGERLAACACLVAFLDRAFLENAGLVRILARRYLAKRGIAVCALEDVEDAELPKGLTGLGKEHWLVYSHGIKAELNMQLVRHLQRLGCRDASALPGFEYEKTEEGIVITRYTGMDPSPRIEASYGDVPVVAIADQAFESCACLKTIAIPAGVTQIGNRAFWGCESLASASIPEGVTQIGDRAFWGCKSLTSASIPAGVTQIGDRAFWGCESLASVSIPEGVTQINVGAFRNCESLVSISIPAGVTQIGEGSFWGCESLASVSIPEGVTQIGRRAFDSCKSLASVSIPDGVVEIGSWAFEDCKNLTSLFIPESVTQIGEDAFFGCAGLAVACPEGSFAWSYCKDHGIPMNPI